MTYVWKPREDGINFREGAHESNVCGKSATGDYTCTRPNGHAGWHIASGIDGAYEVWPDGVFVPVPDGVAYDDALAAVNDARPWVPLPDGPTGAHVGKRLRCAWSTKSHVEDKVHRVSDEGARFWGIPGSWDITSGDWFVHPDDVPDPDAAVKDRLRYLLERSHASMDALVDDVLAVIREDQP